MKKEKNRKAEKKKKSAGAFKGEEGE